MAKNRLLNMTDYGISRERYMELRAFVRQYRNYKRERLDIIGLPSSIPRPVVGADGKAEFMPQNRGSGESSVERAAEKRMALDGKIAMIEESAQQASAALWKAVLRNEVDGVSYYRMNLPCSMRAFINMRKRFYAALHERKTALEENLFFK